jgi:hypothetical protein
MSPGSAKRLVAAGALEELPLRIAAVFIADRGQEGREGAAAIGAGVLAHDRERLDLDVLQIHSSSGGARSRVPAKQFL